MPLSVTEAISIRGKSLRNRLTVIASLVFLIPSLVAMYFYFERKLPVRFDYLHLFMCALTLSLVLAGLVLLREVFDELTMLAGYMKDAEGGKKLSLDVKRNTRELHDISVSFNNLMQKLENTTWLLDDQTGRLKQEMTERMRVEEELREKEKHLTHIAHHDLLTGLPNRELFKEHLKRLLAESRRRKETMAVMLLDLDNFKTINDTLGHVVGDHVLQEAAQRVAGCLRESDIVARLGGDEFSIVLPHLHSPDDSGLVAGKILKSLSTPIQNEGQNLYVSTSIGISLFPNDGEDEHTLLKYADAAMYYAKETGKNTYQHYTTAMSARSYEDLSLSSDLHKALDSEEFFLEYQPLYDLRTGVIDGAEALVRWEHPILGVLGPLKFIPLAERTGLIIPLGEWILQAICDQIRSWSARELMPPGRISVNLSARQFQQKELAQSVERAIMKAGIAPSQLEVEITESIIMQDIQRTIQTLQQLHDLGVRISVDDFGTGYSSLSYLKQFPIHTLKIDRSFTRDITTDPDDAAIVSAIIAMAHSLRLDVIAEGVETTDQLEFLRGLGCDRAQGFLMSRPVHVDAFSSLLAEEGIGEKGVASIDSDDSHSR